MKKQKQIKQQKLVVKTETVRRLADQDLASAAGGYIYVPGLTLALGQCKSGQ